MENEPLETIERIPEGFPNQRLTIVPDQVLSWLEEHSILRQLFLKRIGFFPRAKGHYVNREEPLDEHLLIFCLQGVGCGQVGEVDFSLEAGGVAVLPAGKSHWYQADAKDPWSIGWLHFGGRLAWEYCEGVGLSEDRPALHLKQPEALRDHFEKLYGLSQGAFSDPTLLGIHAGLVSFFATIARARRESVPRVRESAERIERVIRFLKSNVSRNVSLSEMAEVANWTPNHFSYAFRQQVNESPASFFLHLKMSYACERLVSTENTVASIAQELGFEDAFYFSRCFRRCYQMTPTAFRAAGT